MKIAILADIHANLAALQAVITDIATWQPDRVIVAGDIVNRGPQSRACLLLVQQMQHERGWQVVRGNHEEYMLRQAHDRARNDAPLPVGPVFEMMRGSRWTYKQIADLIPVIEAMPEHLAFEVDGQLFWVMHASMRGNRDGILARASDDLLREQINREARVFCVGHTHMPFVRQVDDTLVVNTGAVGLPFDRDTRAAYAQVLWDGTTWQAEIVRVPYDREQTERAFRESDMLEHIGPIAQLMYGELHTGNSYIFSFIPRYHERIVSGEISIAAAVEEFMASEA